MKCKPKKQFQHAVRADFFPETLAPLLSPASLFPAAPLLFSISITSIFSTSFHPCFPISLSHHKSCHTEGNKKGHPNI